MVPQSAWHQMWSFHLAVLRFTANDVLQFRCAAHAVIGMRPNLSAAVLLCHSALLVQAYIYQNWRSAIERCQAYPCSYSYSTQRKAKPVQRCSRKENCSAQASSAQASSAQAR